MAARSETHLRQAARRRQPIRVVWRNGSYVDTIPVSVARRWFCGIYINESFCVDGLRLQQTREISQINALTDVFPFLATAGDWLRDERAWSAWEASTPRQFLTRAQRAGDIIALWRYKDSDAPVFGHPIGIGQERVSMRTIDVTGADAGERKIRLDAIRELSAFGRQELLLQRARQQR